MLDLGGAELRILVLDIFQQDPNGVFFFLVLSNSVTLFLTSGAKSVAKYRSL